MTSATDLRRELELERRLEIERARTSVAGFISYTMPEFDHTWHTRLICKVLDDVAEGRCKRVIISCPPRCGKTEMVSIRFSAYLLGRFERMRILAASYNSTLATRVNRMVQRVIDAPEYATVFPAARLNEKNVRAVSGSWLRNSNEFEIVGRPHSFYKSGGCLSAFTGFGCDIAILDDFLKNRMEANSITIRERLWDWLTSTFMTRLEKNSSMAIIATRWHLDDVIGRLEEQQVKNPDAEQWRIVKLPAIADGTQTEGDPRKEGESIWPFRYSEARLKRIRATIGSRDFSALFQQQPAPSEGDIIKRSWWRFYSELPATLEAVAISADLNIRESLKSDFTVMQVWARAGGKFYLLDQIRERMGWAAQKRALSQLVQRHPAVSAIYIEDAANGAALVEEARRELPFCIPVRPVGDKATRLMAVSAMVEAGNVVLPDPSSAKGQWVSTVIDEIAFFPSGQHDDCVDALALALSAMRKRTYDFGRISSLGEGKESLIGYEPFQ